LDSLIHERTPLTVAAFMELALYHPEYGYYTRATRRSGRAGDFFTSVDVGSTFGELLELQLAEMAEFVPGPFDLVEAGAGNGQLSADILRAARQRHPSLHARVRLHLVEASTAPRTAQTTVLGDDSHLLASSSLPESFEGVLVANELLDAMPVHQVVMRSGGLREVYVDSTDERRGADGHGLTLREGPLSTSALADYLDRLGIVLKPGWKAEINLSAVRWIRDVARRLRRGFVILIDYGHEAAELYSATHALGTLTTFSGHKTSDPGSLIPAWLSRPGEQDITTHVDFTSIRDAAESAGLATLGFLDHTYFLLGLLDARALENPASSVEQLKQRLALKTLLLPGGLGSTMKVLILGKGVGSPALQGCSYRVRVT
jgi:SAM-dependent MidA family methyltransferase